ncbi:hypothetical protein THIOM_004466 [Candidatus Thiomargarita nelsonii]|uniref:Uncharacterized protein n=1 Tax=Candidatus Thiomargarita nelsonii TaxID=1003181 RepID=A0A176RVT7_9GAMM|nr:hypothetical protein THIOM_004466 [Candidatus Thiomargarita nelsonii]
MRRSRLISVEMPRMMAVSSCGSGILRETALLIFLLRLLPTPTLLIPVQAVSQPACG